MIKSQLVVKAEMHNPFCKMRTVTIKNWEHSLWCHEVHLWTVSSTEPQVAKTLNEVSSKLGFKIKSKNFKRNFQSVK